MALMTRDDLKSELQLRDSSDKDLLDAICSAILDMLDYMTNRTMEETAHTEYHNAEEYQNRLFLSNWPVSSLAAFEIHEDPDWVWGSDTLIDADDYRVDYEAGIVYYNSYFLQGRQSIKVEYTAGYTTSTFPASMKQILVRQAVVWYKQAKNETWDVQSITVPAGGGGVSVERHEKGLLPEFLAMVARETGYKEVGM